MNYTIDLSLPEGETLETCSPEVKNALKTLYKNNLVKACKKHECAETLGVEYIMDKVNGIQVCLPGVSSRVVENAMKGLLTQVLFENEDCPSLVFHQRKKELIGYLDKVDLKGKSLDLNEVYNLALSARDCICTRSQLRGNIFDEQ